MALRCRDDAGVSPLTGALLLLALTAVLAILILALLPEFPPTFDLFPQEEPCIFEIVSVLHTNEKGKYTKASIVTLWYNKTPVQVDHHDPATRIKEIFGWVKEVPDREKDYLKDDLWAQFYRNGEPLTFQVSTMDASRLIPTHHYKIKTMNGHGSKWSMNGRITIDFSDGTFGPGDMVRVEIYSKSEEHLISAHTYDA
ncbi:hypothetical protein J2129_001097 [Methanofollis sp. W23]|uniref:hypothetical protein n=1 Tax=Methanofollis sp. W23 TaxID=2817849 RepID=UPI001AEB30B9|nr:hypothetical protein [Methanofollis sp. W23]MBP2145643.1 hypothetical protein [Methanofollis sp. W23]